MKTKAAYSSSFFCKCIMLILVILGFTSCHKHLLLERVGFDVHANGILDSIRSGSYSSALLTIDTLLGSNISDIQRIKLLTLAGIAHHLDQDYFTSNTKLYNANCLLGNIEAETDSLTAEIYFRLAHNHAKLNAPDSARIYYEKALEISTRYWGTDAHLQVINICNDLAGLYAGAWEYRRSLDMRKRALDAVLQMPPTESVIIDRTIRLYNNIGRLYHALLEPELALQYYLSGLRLAREQDDKFHNLAFYLYLNLAELALGESNNHQALYYLNEAETLKNKFPQSTLPEFSWTVKGDVYMNLERLDSAIYCYDTYLQLQQNSKSNSNRLLALGNLKLANGFFFAGMFDTSIHHVKEALLLEREISAEVHIQNVDAYLIMGKSHLAKGEYIEAEQAFKRSLAANNYHGQMASVIGCQQAIISFHELAKTAFMQYERHQNIFFLKQTLEYCKLADEALTYKRFETNYENSKSAANALMGSVYVLGVSTCYLLFEATGNYAYIDDAFYFSERRKYPNLLENVSRQRDFEDANIPREGVIRQRAIQYEMDQLKVMLNKFSHNVLKLNNISGDLRDINLNIHQLHEEFDSLTRISLQELPDQFHSVGDGKIVSLDSLQSYADEQQATILSYFTTQTTLFSFIFRPGRKVFMTTKDLTDNFKITIDRFYYNISQTPGDYTQDEISNRRLYELATDGYLLYQLLLPAMPEALVDQRLIIIPDGDLSFIPFSALLDSPVPQNSILKPSVWPYLIRRTAVSYSYSASLLLAMINKKHHFEPDSVFLGIAPEFTNRITSAQDIDSNSIVPRLLYNVGEIEQLVKYIGAHQCLALTNREATRDRLIVHAPYYQIIHFCTHAFTFTPYKLAPFLLLASSDSTNVKVDSFYFFEFYPLRLNAEMVVLDACKTALGIAIYAEGPWGLTQACVYTGAKSVMSTLWEIKDDQIRLDLVMQFYQYLRRGYTKDEALRGAQLSLLIQGSQTPTYATDPHFWAAMQCIGDTRMLFF